MKTWRCTDGHVTKTIQSNTAQEAAEIYAIVPCTVEVVELVDGQPAGKPVKIEIAAL